MRARPVVLLALAMSAWVAPTRAAEVPVFGVHEVMLTSATPQANPYTDVSLVATFAGPARTIRIEGFWDGGQTWKIRIAPVEPGTWRLQEVRSSDPQLDRQGGEGAQFTAHPPSPAQIADNEVLRHGFVLPTIPLPSNSMPRLFIVWRPELFADWG
jgi:Domain of unknown function (DUF5060)